MQSHSCTLTITTVETLFRVAACCLNAPAAFGQQLQPPLDGSGVTLSSLAVLELEEKTVWFTIFGYDIEGKTAV